VRVSSWCWWCKCQRIPKHRCSRNLHPAWWALLSPRPVLHVVIPSVHHASLHLGPTDGDNNTLDPTRRLRLSCSISTSIPPATASLAPPAVARRERRGRLSAHVRRARTLRQVCLCRVPVPLPAPAGQHARAVRKRRLA
jgi:hypothetical protein